MQWTARLLFVDYIKWVKVLFEGLHIPHSELIESLHITCITLQSHFPEDAVLLARFIDNGVATLNTIACVQVSFLDDSVSPVLATLRQAYLNSLLDGDRLLSGRLIMDALEQGVSIKDIYLFVFQTCQYEIGRLWQINDISVAQEHYCTAVTQLIMSQLYHHIFQHTKTRTVFSCHLCGQ